ncbi:MAG: hypothetical protein NVV72_00460 [Asticcacaulis sp.]|nr:hypothetical protein [Asticcacaulis sp.]
MRDALASDNATERAAALDALGQAADELAAAPDLIRAGVIVPGFATEAQPWLDATALWCRALRLTVDGLRAEDAGSASRLFGEAARLADEAAKIRTIPGATRPEGSIKIADGVLDRFIAEAPGLIYLPAPPPS